MQAQAADSPSDSTDVWAELDRIFEEERRCSSCSEGPVSPLSEGTRCSLAGAFEAESNGESLSRPPTCPGRARSDSPGHAHQRGLRDRKKHFVIVDVDSGWRSPAAGSSSRTQHEASNQRIIPSPREALSESAAASLPSPKSLPPGCQDGEAAQQRCVPDGSRFVDVDPNELQGWELRIAIRALRQRVRYLQQTCVTVTSL